MKYWDYIIKKDLSFKDAIDYISKNKFAYATRPCFNGIHVYNRKGKLCALLENEIILTDIYDSIPDKDKHDWMLVTITDEALAVLEERIII